MKRKYKVIILICFILSALAVFVGCNSEENPYDVNNEKGYTVSIKYDANGGFFTTNTSVIVDSYNLDNINKNSNGEAEIALLPPDDEARGTDAFTVTNNGYFLAGWYEEKHESKDTSGNTVYTYSKKWDFENDLLKVRTDKTYSAKDPVITLYAAWIPMFELAFYEAGTGDLIESIKFNPLEGKEFTVPAWNVETGKIDMNEFPEKKGYTFNGAYLDVSATENSKINDTVIVHPGQIDFLTGTAQNPVFNVYVDFLEGEWFNIYSAEQFISNASVNGKYIINNDLDFEGKTWPTSLMHGNFSGIIQGNGYIFKNITVKQTNNAKANTGLFGQLTDKSNINDVTFENVSLVIEGGSRVVANFGLLAGTISKDSTINKVNIKSSQIMIDSKCYFSASDFSIGLLCGAGDISKVDSFEINCLATGENPDKVSITIDGNQVSVIINK